MLLRTNLNFALILSGLIVFIGIGNTYGQQNSNIKDANNALELSFSNKIDDLDESYKAIQHELSIVKSDLQTSMRANGEIKDSIKLIKLELSNSKAKLTEASFENRLLKQELKQRLEYRDDFSSWTGFLLACVSIILTILGIGIALLAFFGLKELKKAAIEAAVKQSESQVNIAINNGTFNESMHKAVQRVIYRDILSETDFPQNEKGLDDEDM